MTQEKLQNLNSLYTVENFFYRDGVIIFVLVQSIDARVVGRSFHTVEFYGGRLQAFEKVRSLVDDLNGSIKDS